MGRFPSPPPPSTHGGVRVAMYSTVYPVAVLFTTPRRKLTPGAIRWSLIDPMYSMRLILTVSIASVLPPSRFCRPLSLPSAVGPPRYALLLLLGVVWWLLSNTRAPRAAPRGREARRSSSRRIRQRPTPSGWTPSSRTPRPRRRSSRRVP